MKIDVAPNSFTDPALTQLCRRRLDAVLARYADLLSTVSVQLDGSGRACVEVVFRSGVGLAIVQDQVLKTGAVLHLVDRVGRTVARRVAFQ